MTELNDRLKKKETAEFVQSVVRCAEEIELAGGLVKYPSTQAGRKDLERFQKTIYEKVLDAPEPTLVEGEEDPLDAALLVKRFRPEHKVKVASLLNRKKRGLNSTSRKNGGFPVQKCAFPANKKCEVGKLRFLLAFGFPKRGIRCTCIFLKPGPLASKRAHARPSPRRPQQARRRLARPAARRLHGRLRDHQPMARRWAPGLQDKSGGVPRAARKRSWRHGPT